MTDKRKCPKCSSTDTQKFGFKRKAGRKVQRYQCGKGHVFDVETKVGVAKKVAKKRGRPRRTS